MVISQDFLNEMNVAYRQLEQKYSELVCALNHRIFDLESGWYNGHYQKSADGKWARDAYPILVITVRGICDIEIQFDRISVSAKLKRDSALAYSFEKLTAYEFEVYGVEDYLSDYYHPGQTVEDMKNSIRASDETEIGFSFMFPFAVERQQIFDFVKLLRREGFYD